MMKTNSEIILQLEMKNIKMDMSKYSQNEHAQNKKGKVMMPNMKKIRKLTLANIEIY